MAFSPNAQARKSPVAQKVPKYGQKLGQLDADDFSALQQDVAVVRADRVAVDSSAPTLGAETPSSLPGLLDAPVESFTMLAQAPAAVTASAASEASTAGLLGGASATTIGAVALGVVAIGAAASSGGGSSGPKAIAPPTIAAGTAGTIAVTIGADASTAKLYAGTTDITAKFTSAKVGSVVTFTPVSGQVDYTAQSITAKAADASGTLSIDSSSVSYTFDNVPPAAAPTVAAAAAGAIAVTIGSDAATAKLFAGTTDITAKFTSAKVGSVVTFTPVAGQVEFAATAVTAKAADASGNLSGASTALTYNFDNVPPAAAPTVAAGTAAGTIAVTIGSDATTATLFAGTTDITAKFTSAKVGSVVTFTPVAGQVEFAATAVTAKAADASGNLSGASTALTYSYDNVAPAAAPTVAAGTAGTIAVTIGSDAATAALYAGTTDITSKFTLAKVGSVVTFTPVANQVEYSLQAVTSKAGDASGNLSPLSSAVSYTYDNVAPPAPSSVVGSSTSGVVTVGFGTANGQLASTVKLLAGTTDISSKYVADTSVAGTVTFTPVAGQVELTAQTLTATVADAAGNVSVSASSAATYTFDNAIGITSTNVLATPYGASAANYAYSVAEGTYAITIDGFSAGDLIAFKGTSAPAVSIVNTSATDGVVAITASYGSNVVDMTLTGVAPVSDAQVLGVTSFNNVFGVGSLTGSANPVTGGSSAVTITSANSSTAFDAASSNVAYTVSEGTYSASIAQFAAGDSINFSGVAAASLSVVNSNSSDGSVVITGNFGSNVVDLTLTGLSAAQDGAILGQNSFNNLFGTGSLGSTATGSGGTSVAISASNAAAGFSASSGNVAYSIAEGTYSTTITGFGPGDSLSFFGSNTAGLSVTNTSGSDGVVLITGVFNGQAVDVTLSGLSVALDSQVIGVNSFNNAFGAGSIIA